MSTKELGSADAAARAALLKKKLKKSAENREKIFDLNDSISKITTELKEIRSSEKNTRVAKSRQLTHTKTLEVDASKRPPDRYADIRSYSRMDADVWKYDKLRNWFNCYAPPEDIKYEFNASQSGYTIKAD